MQYYHVDYEKLRTFCVHVFEGYGFSEEESAIIKSTGTRKAYLYQNLQHPDKFPLRPEYILLLFVEPFHIKIQANIPSHLSY